MFKFIKKYYIDTAFIFLITLLSPLFFYKLGQSSLVSWDEAWYGEIAKNIMLTGNLFELKFNDSPYFDHPPGGFWLIALSMKILGVSDFSARFAPALLGLLALVVIYFLGKELFSRTVGFAAAISLGSSFWFLTRARSGNLDSILTFFFILTFLLALKASKNKKFLIPFLISFSLLFLTKTLIPFTILPSLFLIFRNSNIFSGIEFRISTMIFIVSFGTWVLVQLFGNPNFLSHYIKIGSPGIGIKTSFLDNLKLAKEYLHNGIGKWFWPGIISIFLSLFLRQKSFLILTLFFVTFSVPFLFSSKGQIWHLIPLHPFLILAFFGFLYELFGIFFRKFKIGFLSRRLNIEYLKFLTLILVAIYLSVPQIQRVWRESIDIPPFISDEAILSKEVGKYSEKYYIDDDFIPAAVFYSGKHVEKIWPTGVSDLFSGNESFLLLTKQWRLDEAGISNDQYKVLKTDRDKILLLKKAPNP